jgi:Fe-S oxidoreductase
MASYKAEFLSHYYEGRLRPRQAYVFGLSMYWLRLGSLLPRLANMFTQTPGLSRLMKFLGGVAPQRTIPKLPTQTFRQKFSENSAVGTSSVLLWPDTFTNHLHPEIGQAAVQVLNHFKYNVQLPAAGLCCGRPLYDYGFLPLAKKMLRQILDTMRPQIEAGMPLIGLEPSCVAVFRDELCNLFPNDPLAKQLKAQTFLLSEFLLKEGVTLPAAVKGEAILQTHCHQKSVLSASTELDLLKRLGFAVREPESGCCGMAGSFGFEPDHHELAQALGERALLPAVRAASDGTAVVANGFSCREQIQQGTGKRPQHLAEILRDRILTH